MKKLMLIVATLIFTFLSGCASDADVASHNLSKDAEMFRINRRIVFYNGVTDAYILSIEGRCSIEFYSLKFTVTCKTGPEAYKKHYLGRADNVFPFVEQLDSAGVDVYQYKVIFKPESIIPDVELSTSS
ncbi:hypothetical protein KAR91_23705 [Candidatus Pacearchaeota archaeon]|nr:hypothetical protein [Candidatus Pacearchaeota archaeon]